MRCNHKNVLRSNWLNPFFIIISLLQCARAPIFCFVLFFSLSFFFFFLWSFLGVGLNDLRNLCISASSVPLSSSNHVVICMFVCLCNSSVLETPFMRAQIVLLISFGVWTGFSCFYSFVILRSEKKSGQHHWAVSTRDLNMQLPLSAFHALNSAFYEITFHSNRFPRCRCWLECAFQ